MWGDTARRKMMQSTSTRGYSSSIADEARRRGHWVGRDSHENASPNLAVRTEKVHDAGVQNEKNVPSAAARGRCERIRLSYCSFWRSSRQGACFCT